MDFVSSLPQLLASVSRLGRGLVACSVAYLLASGCAGESDPVRTDGTGGANNEARAECAAIGELCHAADVGAGPLHECHEIGHVGDVSQCAAHFAECVGLCVRSEGDDPESGVADGYCAALGELCHPVDELSPMLHDCHEVGHRGEATACKQAFDACATMCLRALEDSENDASAGGAAAH